MPYLIRCYDKADSAALRAATRDAHLAYIKPYATRILAGGSFLDDDGSVGAGGLIIFDSDERAEVEQFAANDPYNLAGLFERIEIIRWRKVLFDGRFVKQSP